MLSFEEVNILGQVLNDTFGKSSTMTSSTCSIKAQLQGNTLNVSYLTVVNLVQGEIQPQLKEQDRVSIKLTDDFIKNVKKEFKDAADHALKLKKGDSSISIEHVSMSPYNPKKTVYYRRKTAYQIGD
jgi:hypothetical protein